MSLLPDHKSSSDIKPFEHGFWLLLPLWVRDMLILMRIDRPIGWWLLLLPGWIIMPVAARLYDIAPTRLLWLMGLFWIGAIVMRGAGCIINDIWDRDIDPLVARTSTRPIADGRVSVFAALVMLAALGGIGLVILIQLPAKAILTGCTALPLIVIYPLAKRFTGYPQIVLGLTFAWGVFLGWAACDIWPDMRVLWLYSAMALWTFGYDTIYATQDMADDIKIGIGSSALSLRNRIKASVGCVYVLVIIDLICFAVTIDAGWGMAAAIAITGLHFFWQIRCFDENNPAMAGVLFRRNRDVGLILTGGALIDYALTYGMVWQMAA
jgi:4-hydroxybenzoate polyprenyltransferase